MNDQQTNTTPRNLETVYHAPDVEALLPMRESFTLTLKNWIEQQGMQVDRQRLAAAIKPNTLPEAADDLYIATRKTDPETSAAAAHLAREIFTRAKIEAQAPEINRRAALLNLAHIALTVFLILSRYQHALDVEAVTAGAYNETKLSEEYARRSYLLIPEMKEYKRHALEALLQALDA